MKINRGKTKERRPRVKDLGTGQVFDYNGELYMITDGSEIKHPHSFGIVAVHLGNGVIAFLDGEDRVTPDHGEYVPSC